MTMIIVDSSILAPFRELLRKTLPEKLYKLVECYQCTGFWSGIVCGLILIDINPFIVFMCGCAGSAASTFWATYLVYLEARSYVDLKEESD